MKELKDQIIRDLRRDCRELEGEMHTHELTPGDVAELRESIADHMQKLGLRATDYGRLSVTITTIIGLEKEQGIENGTCISQGFFNRKVSG